MSKKIVLTQEELEKEKKPWIKPEIRRISKEEAEKKFATVGKTIPVLPTAQSPLVLSVIVDNHKINIQSQPFMAAAKDLAMVLTQMCLTFDCKEINCRMLSSASKFTLNKNIAISVGYKELLKDEQED